MTFSMRLQLTLKTIFDRIVALISMVGTMPLWLVIALAIYLEDGSPIFFVQQRLGRNGIVFPMYKFRSMRVDSSPVLNDDGSLRVDRVDSRVTRIGAILRRTSLDELPQLVNVFVGQMSLVGPRPDLPEHMLLYTDTERMKLRMLPGITGLPQVMGRNNLPWKERIRLDNQYIDTYSIWWDVKILFGTFYVVATGKGVIASKETRHDHS